MSKRIALGVKLGLSPSQAKTLANLNSPEKIQDFLDTFPTNHELDGDTCMSVASSLSFKAIHCIEGAFIAACALWMQGKPPLLLDLKARGDDDHVVTLFKQGKHWGAISKSNHIWLRWRDPVYKSVRELAMSYFHEYVTNSSKSLRAYSRPFDLRYCDPKDWISAKDSCWDVAWKLDQSLHYEIITSQQARRLRSRDAFEQKLGKVVESPDPRSRHKKKQ